MGTRTWYSQRPLRGGQDAMIDAACDWRIRLLPTWSVLKPARFSLKLGTYSGCGRPTEAHHHSRLLAN